jgi:hypothetical protein
MKKAAMILLAIGAYIRVNAQSVWVMDFVEVKNGKAAELAYFINENWKPFRVEALQQKVIKSYKVLKTSPDSTAAFSYILMTEFADSTALKMSEERFRPIMKKVRPDGAKFLNEIRPNDFRAIPISKEATEIISSKSTISPKIR